MQFVVVEVDSQRRGVGAEAEPRPRIVPVVVPVMPEQTVEADPRFAFRRTDDLLVDVVGVFESGIVGVDEFAECGTGGKKKQNNEAGKFHLYRALEHIPK